MSVSGTLRNIYKGEKKYLKFTVRDRNGDPVNLTYATVSAEAHDADGSLFSYIDSEFTKTEQAAGIVKVLANFSAAGTWTLVFTAEFTNGEVEKAEFELVIIDRDPPV